MRGIRIGGWALALPALILIGLFLLLPGVLAQLHMQTARCNQHDTPLQAVAVARLTDIHGTVVKGVLA